MSVNMARFTINSTPPEDVDGKRGYDALAGETLDITLDRNPALGVLTVTYEISDFQISEAAVDQVFVESGTNTVTLTSVNDHVHIVVDALTSMSSYLLKATVVDASGSSSFERMFVIRSNGIRKVIPAESTQYSPKGWSEAVNEAATFASQSMSSGQLIYANHAEFRLLPSMADGTYFKIVSPPGEFRYSSTSGAGFADNGKDCLKLDSIDVSANGRAYSTRAGETVATFAALSGLVSGLQDHIHVQAHTTFGDGGGGIFDVKAIGSYVADGGTVAVSPTNAFVRRTEGTGYIRFAWFGPDKTGATNVSQKFNAAFAVCRKIIWDDDGIYLFNTAVTAVGDGIDMQFGKAEIRNGGLQYIFNFGTYGGTYGTTYQNVGLTIDGGVFKQLYPTSIYDLNYIIVRAIKDIKINGCVLHNVGAAGVQIQVGCVDGTIESITVEGTTRYSDCIGVVLSGSNAPDYAGGIYVSEETLERNSTPLPSYFVDNVKVINSTFNVPTGYGIYAMNTRNCAAHNNTIHLGAGHKRGIAIHNYSPGFKATKNTITATDNASAIIVTQCATGVIIEGNTFKGNFGTYRTIAVSTLAQALIQGNTFEDETDQNIYVCANGFAVVQNNTFCKPSSADRLSGNRCVWVTATDQTQPTNLVVGRLAGTLAKSGVIFRNNTLINQSVGVHVETHHTCDNGNQPAVGIVQVEDNTFIGADQATVGEFPLIVRAGTGSNLTNIRYRKNTILPYTASAQDVAFIEAGTAYLYEAQDAQTATYDLAVASGTASASKVAGDCLGLSAARSGETIVLTPRTQNGASGAVTVPVVAVVDHGGTVPVHRSSIVKSGDDYVVRLFDSSGSQVSISANNVSLRATIGPTSMNVGWSTYDYAQFLIDLSAAVGGLAHITCLCLGEDIVGAVGNPVTGWPAKIGNALTPYGTGRAVIAESGGFRYAAFAGMADITAYISTQGAGQISRVALALRSGPIPAARTEFLVHDPTSDGTLYNSSVGDAGWSTTVSAPFYIDRDYTSVYPDNTKAHLLTKVASSSISNTCYLGGRASGVAANNFEGGVWMYMQTNNVLTRSNTRDIHAVCKRYFPFLGAA